MRIALFSIGSRGDVEPYAALVQELVKRYESVRELYVDWFVQSNLQTITSPFHDHPFVSVYILPFETRDFYRVTQENEQNLTYEYPDHPTDLRMANVKHMAKIVGELILPCFPLVRETLEENKNGKCTSIITCAFARPLAFLLHQDLKIPVLLLHLQPLLPNAIIPSYRTNRSGFVQTCVGSLRHADLITAAHLVNNDVEDTYWKIESALEQVFWKDAVDRVSGRYGIQSLTWLEIKRMLQGYNSKIWIINAYSNELIPKLDNSPAVGPYVQEVGPLADDYVPPGAMVQGGEAQHSGLWEFLANAPTSGGEKAEKPICVGFGSMPIPDPRVILLAMQKMRRRAILVGEAWAGILPASHPARQEGWIYCISSIPYTRLLPHCEMMVCHGGIGVLQTCLRIGIPTVIYPVMGDQFALAELVEQLEYGVACRPKRSPMQLEEMVLAMTQALDCIETCQALGHRIRSENNHGRGAIVDLLQRICHAQNV